MQLKNRPVNAARRARSLAPSALILLVSAGTACGAPLFDAPTLAPTDTECDTEGLRAPAPAKVFADVTIVDRLPQRDDVVAPIEFGVFDPAGLQEQIEYDRFVDALEGTIDSSVYADYTGATPFAQSVRYVEDFEDTSVERPEWSGLRTQAFDGMSRVAGPFRNGETGVRVESKVGTLYMVRFDLTLIAARLGSTSASDTFVVEIDGEPVLERQLHEYTSIAMDLREDVEAPLVVPKVQLFFRAGHRITTISFRSEAAGALGGEVWGLDNVVIDRVQTNPSEVESPDYYAGSGGGGGGGGFGARGLPGGGGGGASSGGRRSRDGGNDPNRARFPDEVIFPSDDPITPAPDQPPTPVDPPDNREPGPPGDPPEPPTPPTPPTPEVPAPGTGVIFGLGALAMGRRRRRD